MLAGVGRVGRVGMPGGGGRLSWALDAGYAFDFPANAARWANGFVGALANTPGWTFSRASTGYALNNAGQLVSFASGAPRITDRGFLAEGSRTNLLTRSQEFENAAWTKFATAITPNSAEAPDGTMTAALFTPDGTAAPHYVRQFVTAVAEIRSAQLFVKVPSGSTVDRVSIYPGGTGSLARFYLDTMSTSSSEANVTSASIAALANGWYLLRATWNTASSWDRVSIYASSGVSGDASTAGDGTSILIWGAQLEAASFPSSYIPTTTASVTRAADLLSIGSVTGLDYPITAYARIRRAIDTGGIETWLSLNDGTENERARIITNASDLAEVTMTDGGVDVAAVSVAGAMGVNTVYNIAGRFAANDVQACRTGTLGTADTSAAVPTAPSVVRFGGGVSGALPCFGYIERIALFGRALTNAELQGLAP